MSMRDAFLDELYNLAADDQGVVLITADFGAPSLDKFKKDLSGQFINVGIAEQNMVSLAAGLALAGKTVFCYAIAPFLTMRCLEQIRVDLCLMNLPVTLIGVGAGYAYDDSGPTHHGLEDIAVMRALPGMTIWNASDSVMAAGLAPLAHRTPGPKYVRLDRAELPAIYETDDFASGRAYLRQGRTLTLVATGYMVHRALEVAEALGKEGLDAEVVDLYRIKPLGQEFMSNLAAWKPVVTLEENFLTGGIGTAFAEFLADDDKHIALKRLAIPDGYSFNYGGRDRLHRDCGLDADTISRTILEWLKEVG